MHRRLRLQVRQLLSSTERRTIQGLAVPLDEAVDLGMSRTVRFRPESVTFERDTTPLLLHHDPARPVGRLTAYEWTDRGLEVEFRVAQTAEGDDALQLANEGILGLSVGVDVPEGLHDDGEYLFVTSSNCFEISLVSQPQFSGAQLTSVTLSRREDPVEDEELTITAAEGDVVVNVNDTLGDAAQTIVDSMGAGDGGDTATAAAPAAEPSRLSRTVARVQPVPRPTIRAQRQSPYPHLFGRPSNGRLWLRDMAIARGLISPTSQDGGYQERLHQLRLAVTTADLPVSDPPNAPGVIGPPPDPANPLSGIVTTRSLPSDGGGPFYTVTASNTGEANLSNPHVEGVEPILGDIGGFTRELVTPSAVSGKVAVTREAALAPTPDMEAIVFGRMDVARRKAVETAFATALGAVTLPAGQVKTAGGTNAGDEIMGIQLDLLYSNDPGRFTRMIASRSLFADLANAKDTAGRPLYPIYNPTNANGQTQPDLSYMNVNGILVYPVAGLASQQSYLLDPDAVINYLGPVLEFTFDYEVAWLRLAHFQFGATAIVDKSGIIRVNYSAA